MCLSPFDKNCVPLLIGNRVSDGHCISGCLVLRQLQTFQSFSLMIISHLISWDVIFLLHWSGEWKETLISVYKWLFTTWQKLCFHFQPSKRTNRACRYQAGLESPAAWHWRRSGWGCGHSHRSTSGSRHVEAEASIFALSWSGATFSEFFQSFRGAGNRWWQRAESISGWKKRS